MNKHKMNLDKLLKISVGQGLSLDDLKTQIIKLKEKTNKDNIEIDDDISEIIERLTKLKKRLKKGCNGPNR